MCLGCGNVIHVGSYSNNVYCPICANARRQEEQQRLQSQPNPYPSDYRPAPSHDPAHAVIGFLVVISIPILIVFFLVRGCRHEVVKKEVQKVAEGGRVDFILLKELNGEHEEKVVKACQGLWDETKPVLKTSNQTSNQKTHITEWFVVDQTRYHGPGAAPTFIERSQEVPAGILDSGPLYWVIYAAFKSDPLNQTRTWLKDNGYSESDFQFVMKEVQNDVDRQGTRDVRPRRDESVILLKAEFRTSLGSIWQWDGSEVRDISEYGDDSDFDKQFANIAK